MSHAIIRRFPDSSGCSHKQTSSPRSVDGVEFAQCFDCNLQIAFHLDRSGDRTGLTEIIKLEEIPAGIVVGYHSSTGVKLFEEANRAARFPDGTVALPKAGDEYVHDGKYYKVIGIRKGSTETYCAMDVLPLQSDSPK